MKQKMSVILTLCFFFILIWGAYTFSGLKTIKRYTAWAKGHLTVEEGKYDVIVVGSDPEGITAAVSAARSGARVLLLGKEDGPGGLLTYGMLNTLDMNRNSEEVILTRGIFSEFYSAIGNTESFDVEKAKSVFTELIENEEMLEYKPNYKFSKACTDISLAPLHTRPVSQSSQICDLFIALIEQMKRSFIAIVKVVCLNNRCHNSFHISITKHKWNLGVLQALIDFHTFCHIFQNNRYNDKAIHTGSDQSPDIFTLTFCVVLRIAQNQIGVMFTGKPFSIACHLCINIF